VNCSDWQPCPKGVNETAFFFILIFLFLASPFTHLTYVRVFKVFLDRILEQEYGSQVY
jgi:hypothetical protein